MNATLTDRYIDAVTRRVPEKQRDDVAAELRGSIADQIDARAAAGETPEHAERDVLTGLGDPEVLAAGYADRPLQLIGPRFYLTWKRLLVLLLWIVPVFAAFGVALGQTLAGGTLGEIIGSTASVGISVAMHLCFWVTLVFAVLDRTGAVDALSPWSLDRLPERRQNGATASDLIATLIFCALMAAALVWDATIGVVFLRGQWHSLLNPAMWPGWTAVLLGLIALEAVLAIVVYATTRWTLPLAIVNAVLAVIAAGILLSALARGLLINPDLIGIARDSGASPDLAHVLSVVTGFCIVGIAAWDGIDGFLKARRAAL